MATGPPNATWGIDGSVDVKVGLSQPLRRPRIHGLGDSLLAMPGIVSLNRDDNRVERSRSGGKEPFDFMVRPVR